MEPKTFSIARADRPGIYATGFPKLGRPSFVEVVVGDTAHDGVFSVILSIQDAIALSLALSDAVAFADPAAAEAAALGRLEEVTR